MHHAFPFFSLFTSFMYSWFRGISIKGKGRMLRSYLLLPPLLLFAWSGGGFSVIGWARYWEESCAQSSWDFMYSLGTQTGLEAPNHWGTPWHQQRDDDEQGSPVRLQYPIHLDTWFNQLQDRWPLFLMRLLLNETDAQISTHILSYVVVSYHFLFFTSFYRIMSYNVS